MKVTWLMDHLDSATLDPDSTGAWSGVLTSNRMGELERFWGMADKKIIDNGENTAIRILSEGTGFLSA